MLPSIFGENLFDEFFGNAFDDYMKDTQRALYGKHSKNLMKTDVKETDESYEVDIDLPGFQKDEVSLDLKNGYLTVSAAKGLDKDEEDKKGRYIRQERYAGSCSRSFYVGDIRPGDALGFLRATRTVAVLFFLESACKSIFFVAQFCRPLKVLRADRLFFVTCDGTETLLHGVQLGGCRRGFDSDFCRSFIHEVDGFIGQEPVG